MITFKETRALKDYDSVSLAEMLRDHFYENYPAKDMTRLGDAIQMASYLHRQDVRRGNRGKLPNPPYIEHPLRVALRLVRFGVTDVDLILASILHDTVEDHAHEFSDFEGVNRSNSTDEDMARMRALEFISQKLGHRVASIVGYVSNPVLPKGISKEEKISSYHEHIVKIINISQKALLLKVSDFIDNAGSLHHHYEYSDKSAQYFVERYAPLLPLYTEAVKEQPERDFLKVDVLIRLSQVDGQFEKFQTH